MLRYVDFFCGYGESLKDISYEVYIAGISFSKRSIWKSMAWERAESQYAPIII